jgi:DNA-binding GntR family transcriptional regulator
MDGTKPRQRLRTRFKPARLKLSVSTAKRPLGRPSLHDLLVVRLREMIVDGELRSGMPLPEQMLCDTFGISRTPLREAFKVLASEGLIELRPNRTPIIAPIDRDEIAQSFEVMIVLDTLAATKAVALATADDLARLDDMHAQLVKFHRDGERAAYFRLNQKIHTEITMLSHNQVLLSTWTTLHAKIFRARALANYDPVRWADSVKEHEEFMEHLRARDGKGFVKALSEHTRRTADAVLASLD